MDNQSRTEGNSATLNWQTLIQGLRVGELTLKAFEEQFLDILSSDIDTAEKLVNSLKHQRLRLSQEDKANKYWLIARFHEMRSDHKLAIRWTQKALSGYREVDNRRRIHQCLRLLFTSSTHLGMHDRARFYADQSLSDSQLPSEERVRIHGNLGALSYRIHHYPQALYHYSTALNLFADGEDDRARAVLLYNLGNLYVCLNKFVEAEANFEQAYFLFRKFNLRLFQAHSLQSFGYLYTIMGQYFHAETKLTGAKRIYLEGGDQTGAALCDIDLLRLDTRLNRFKRALERVPILGEAFLEIGRTSELGLIYYHGILCAVALKDFDLSEEYLAQAIRIFKKEKNQHFLALCSMIEGLIYWHREQPEKGLKHLLKARDVFASSKIHELELECLIYITRIRNQELDRKGFQRLRYLQKFPLSPTVRIQSLIMVHHYWFRRGQIKKAIRGLFEAVNIIEESRASILHQKLRESFFEDKAEVYELLIERLFVWRDQKAAQLIFKVMELSRSRQMSELLSSRENLPPVLNKDEPLILELHRLDLRIKQLNRKLEALSTSETTSKIEKSTLIDAIAETRFELNRVRGQMRNEERLSLFYPIEFKPEEIRKRLIPGQLLVIYFLSQSTLYRIEMDLVSLKTYRNTLPAQFRRNFNQLLNILANRISSKSVRGFTLATQLSEVLMPRKTEGVRHYTFILHKSLQRFPLALLNRDGHYLIERATISQFPNLPAFYYSQKEKAPRFKSPVFFFSDLPDDPAASERQLLGEKFPHAPVFHDLDNPDIEKALAGSDFIHFAGHCHFNRRRPAESFLQLGGKQLSLPRFARMPLSEHPFINLAACSSGWMALSSGNEPNGFVISSFAAGATNLLASLWDIDDEATGAWMNVFYGAIHKGLPQAYRQACLALMNKRSDPYFWAGFCLLGKA